MPQCVILHPHRGATPTWYQQQFARQNVTSTKLPTATRAAFYIYSASVTRLLYTSTPVKGVDMVLMDRYGPMPARSNCPKRQNLAADNWGESADLRTTNACESPVVCSTTKFVHYVPIDVIYFAQLNPIPIFVVRAHFIIAPCRHTPP